MRLVTFSVRNGASLQPKQVGVMVDEYVVPVSSLDPSLPSTLIGLLAAGEDALTRLRDAVETSARRAPQIASTQVRLFAPIPNPPNVVGIGRNYRAHAAEEGKIAPTNPTIFLKHTSSVVGPHDAISWDPEYTKQVDFEAELGVVIGKPARGLSVEQALRHVAGYMCLNDITARDHQVGDQQWARGKSLETFCPTGPALVTADEVPDVQDLRIRCLLNGEVMQDARTRDMIHSVAEIVAYCSEAFTLQTGDVIATGTPAGVGAYREVPALLQPGDNVTVEVEGVGRLTNTCMNWTTRMGDTNKTFSPAG